MTDPRAATSLYLIRHGPPIASMEGCCLARDAHVSRAGLERIQLLATTMTGLGVAAVCSSRLRRAVETASPIGVATGREVVPLSGLNEIDFGSWEGLTFAEIARLEPDRYAEWMATPWKMVFPGGESFSGMRARVLSTVRAIRHDHGGAVVVVVTHAGPIRAILADVLAIPDDAVFRVAIDHLTVTLVEWMGEEPSVRSVNLASLLGRAATTRQ